jgi:hypothetical protein
VFSKSMRKPIEDGGTLDEAEEGEGEFVAAGGRAAAAFDAGDGVFHGMALPAKATPEAVGPMAG